MTIIGYKPSHDGALACIKDGELQFSIESEEDSRPRHSHVKPNDWLRALARLKEFPDVVAIGGWHLNPFSEAYSAAEDASCAYRGLATGLHSETVLGRRLQVFTSTHERSHILASYSLSPYDQGMPCYALIWEGRVGMFYRVDKNVQCTPIGSALDSPGLRYSYLYYLADAMQTTFRHPSNASGPGKLMALTSYASGRPLSGESLSLIDYLLSPLAYRHITDPGIVKTNFPFKTGLLNIGVEAPQFKDLAKAFSDRIFDLFYRFASSHLRENLPLLIGGGCGLNCEWNTRWRDCGLFPSVFVPPCTDDSGSALGSAMDAQFCLTGQAKLRWTVYAGEEFVNDSEVPSDFCVLALNLDVVAQYLFEGHIVAWVQGRCEIGPRALGHRSLLASPFDKGMAGRINDIKQREQFRPIAPACLAEDLHLHFDDARESPYMLYFQKVIDSSLCGITHVDGTARVQSVTKSQEPRFHSLLHSFKRLSGKGVLCNTSLNFKGRGFINRLSDVFKYCRNNSVRCAVVNEHIYVRLAKARW